MNLCKRGFCAFSRAFLPHIVTSYLPSSAKLGWFGAISVVPISETRCTLPRGQHTRPLAVRARADNEDDKSRTLRLFRSVRVLGIWG